MRATSPAVRAARRKSRPTPAAKLSFFFGALCRVVVGLAPAIPVSTRNQSLARELGPAGIHVVHFVIDGGVVQGSDDVGVFTPRATAQSYMAAVAQPPGAWSWEIELRSHVEPF
jgi:hypothetical protein